jgi:hypothetical protein
MTLFLTLGGRIQCTLKRYATKNIPDIENSWLLSDGSARAWLDGDGALPVLPTAAGYLAIEII